MTSRRKFDLHQVLNYRVDVEKVRKQEFAAAKRELDHATDRLERHRSDMDRLSEEFSQHCGRFESIAELQMYNDFFARKREEIKLQQEQIVALDRVMNDRRGELVEATKEKKVLEALKDKKDREFSMEMERKERDFIDEMSVQKKGRD